MSDHSVPSSPPEDRRAADQRAAVRTRYATIATDSGSCCDGSTVTSCCEESSAAPGEIDDNSRSLGYSAADVAAVAPGADLGLGCGNPTAIANLSTGDTVLDLGSGAGFDCFLAGRAVGPSGRVIGVDMTPAMVERARENIGKNGVSNVEFRLGEIEHLPVADETVDVIISNCVVNLSPDKPQVLAEAHRVLGPGGWIAISDVVKTAEFPPELSADSESVAGCVTGAVTVSELETMMDDAGFGEVAIEPLEASRESIRQWDDEHDLSEYLVSATIEGTKPIE